MVNDGVGEHRGNQDREQLFAVFGDSSRVKVFIGTKRPSYKEEEPRIGRISSKPPRNGGFTLRDRGRRAFVDLTIPAAPIFGNLPADGWTSEAFPAISEQLVKNYLRKMGG